MRLTHRVLTALLALFLCLSGSAAHTPRFAASAFAEENAPSLEISVAAEPDALVSPDEITLTFALTNESRELLEAVSLTSADALLVEPIGNLEPGASAVYSRSHLLTQEELDNGQVEYIITCVCGSEHFSYPVSAAIEKLDAEPEVEFLRTVSGTQVTADGSATIVYEIHNVGNVPIGAISVNDPLGGFDSRLELLGVGESKVFLQHAAITEDAVSAPVLTYSTAGGEDFYTVRLDELPVTVGFGMLDAYITAGRSLFSHDTSEVVLTLINSGTVDYRNITVYDDIYGGVIADSVSVPAGSEPVEIEHSYPIREDSSYRWRIVGQTSAGDQIDFITNTASVYLDAEGDSPLLSLKAVTAMPEISRAGFVPVRLELTNIGSAMAGQVVIREQSGGKVCELAVVPLGEPTVREILYEVTQSSSLVFTAAYVDSYGQERIAASEPVAVTICRGGQTPAIDDRGNTLYSGIATQIRNPRLFIALLILCVAALLVMIVVLLVNARRLRKQRRARASARKQRIKEEMAKTAPFKPVRAKLKKKSRAKKN